MFVQIFSQRHCLAGDLAQHALDSGGGRFGIKESLKSNELKHTTLAIARLRFLFVAAKIWRHAGRVGISYSDQYAEKGLLQRLMDRLRSINKGLAGFLPALATPLSE